MCFISLLNSLFLIHFNVNMVHTNAKLNPLCASWHNFNSKKIKLLNINFTAVNYVLIKDITEHIKIPALN
jgi:hypothetical protein